jgi:hypothetical protein
MPGASKCRQTRISLSFFLSPMLPERLSLKPSCPTAGTASNCSTMNKLLLLGLWHLRSRILSHSPDRERQQQPACPRREKSDARGGPWQANGCVLATARGALRKGCSVGVFSSCVASRTLRVTQRSLDRMAKLGVTVLNPTDPLAVVPSFVEKLIPSDAPLPGELRFHHVLPSNASRHQVLGWLFPAGLGTKRPAKKPTALVNMLNTISGLTIMVVDD